MRDQDPARDGPRGCLIASGIFAKARTGQYPSGPYLGIRGLGLKPLREPLHALGEPAERIGDARVRLIGRRIAGAMLLDLVGEEEGGEQALAHLAEAAARLRG